MKLLWPVLLFRRKSAAPSRDGVASESIHGERKTGTQAVGERDAREGLPLRDPIAAPRLESINGVRQLPRPAIRWVGQAGRIALRPFDFNADTEAVCSFQEETYGRNFPDFRYTPSFAAAFRHDLRRAALDGQHGLFVLDEGEIIGFLWLVICQNSWTGERYGYVNNLYVAPSRRGQDLGKELMRHSDHFFRSRGIKRARLTVTATNHAACSLYAAAGYKTERWEMEKEL